MVTLDEARTTGDSAADHVSDHNTLHAWNNGFDGGGGISIEATDSTIGTTNPTLTWPTTESGDYAFVFVVTRNATCTGPDGGTGWTEVLNEDYYIQGDELFQVWYQKCDGTESGTISFTVASSNVVGLVLVRGADGTNPVRVAHGAFNSRALITPISEVAPTDYLLYWGAAAAISGTPTFSASNPARTLTEHLSMIDGSNLVKCVIAGRQSKHVVAFPEVVEGLAWRSNTETYCTAGVLALQEA